MILSSNTSKGSNCAGTSRCSSQAFSVLTHYCSRYTLSRLRAKSAARCDWTGGHLCITGPQEEL
jgi:hypothetical protein